MKKSSKQLLRLIAIVAVLSSLNVRAQPTSSVPCACPSMRGSSMPSSASPTSPSMSMGSDSCSPSSTSKASTMSSTMSMGDSMSGSTDTHWKQVEGSAFKPTGTVRTYYLGAVEEIWDYAPQGYNVITGKNFTAAEAIFAQSGVNQIGSKYLKCLYREFTDSTFTKMKPQSEEQTQVGISGPVLRAEVGDVIKVVYHNKCRFPNSVHPHGVFYKKSSEGAPYNDGTSGADKLDDAVKPNTTYTYTWNVPERAGPGPMDGSSVMWMYHSHTDEVSDYYAGLIGFIAITAKGKANAHDGSPKDVDHEVFMLFSVFDETSSPYFALNTQMFAKPGNATQAPPTSGAPPTDPDQKYSINGYIYGNSPLLSLVKGERVRWYVMSMGGGEDTHSPHWHGNDLLINGMRMDVIGLAPAAMTVGDMVPDDVGIWLYHCHVNDHLINGMVTRYQVKDSGCSK